MASQATARAVERVERRRSPRLPNNVTFVAFGESTKKQLFQEEAFTLSINAHGALIALTTQVALGQKLLLINPKTWNKRESRVIRLGALQGEWTQVAIEFAEPTPEFWPIGAPPKTAFAHWH
jgi:hypothetical protein